MKEFLTTTLVLFSMVMMGYFLAQAEKRETNNGAKQKNELQRLRDENAGLKDRLKSLGLLK
jgi:hypothetical protein